MKTWQQLTVGDYIQADSGDRPSKTSVIVEDEGRMIRMLVSYGALIWTYKAGMREATKLQWAEEANKLAFDRRYELLGDNHG